MQTHARPPHSVGLVGRLFGTAALLSLFGLLCWVPLPGLDPNHVLPAGPSLSLMAVGTSTSVSAFVCVELAALVLPRWRRLRFSVVGRAKLDRAVLISVLVLGAMQVFGVVLSLRRLSDTDPRIPMLEGRSEAWVAACLFTGLLIAFVIARGTSKLALLNGFSVLALVDALRYSKASASGSAAFASVFGGPHPWTVVCAVLLLVLATVACFPGSTARKGQPESPSPFALPVPASSMQPLLIAGGAFNLLVLAFSEAPGVPPSWLRMIVEGPWARAGLTLTVGMPLIWAFNRPRSVSEVFSRWVGVGPAAQLAQRAFRESIVPTLLFLLILALSEALLPSAFEVRGMASLVPTAVAIVLDFVAAVQVHRAGTWARAWRDPRPYALPVVQRVLHAADIPVRALSLSQASLFRIFGPYVLTEAWVPAPQAALATELIEGALSAEANAPSDVGASDLTVPPEQAAMRRRQLYQLTALAAVAALVCLATAGERR